LVIVDAQKSELEELKSDLQKSGAYPLPLLLVSAEYDPDLIECAGPDLLLAYLIKPIRDVDLRAAIAMAMRQFLCLQKLHQEITELRRTLADREIIERAKSLLMKKLRLDEQQAFRRIQKMAMNSKQKMVDVAQGILGAKETPPAQ
jgi:response regulator NasT